MRDVNAVCNDNAKTNIAQTIFTDTPHYNTENITKIDGFEVDIDIKKEITNVRVSVNIGRVGHYDGDDRRVTCFYIYRDGKQIKDILGSNSTDVRNATFCTSTIGNDESDNSASFEFIDKNVTKGKHTYDVRLVAQDDVYINRGKYDNNNAYARWCASTIIVEEL